MFKIVPKNVTLNFPLGHHLHCMISQIPNEIRCPGEADGAAVSQRKWQRINSVLQLVAGGHGNLKKLHFLLFPETTLPADFLEQALTIVANSFAVNTVTVFGVEHLGLPAFLEVVQRYRGDNEELYQSVVADRDAGEIDNLSVNWAVTAVKEDDGRLRVFLQAKSHPFAGEESMDGHDLYHGKIFPLFHSQPTGFNFMAMICFDYIYRTVYHSNIMTVIHYANELFFTTRQCLDLLMVLECNPKPEHAVFRDVVHGFYGELLAAAPGVRDTITVFCNSSAQTGQTLAQPIQGGFGRSSVFIHKNHKMVAGHLHEFATDDFNGLPVCRLRFGTASRLYYFNLPVFHESDPRSTRMPLKVHSIFKPATTNGWQRLLPPAEGEAGHCQ